MKLLHGDLQPRLWASSGDAFPPAGKPVSRDWASLLDGTEHYHRHWCLFMCEAGTTAGVYIGVCVDSRTCDGPARRTPTRLLRYHRRQIDFPAGQIPAPKDRTRSTTSLGNPGTHRQHGDSRDRSRYRRQCDLLTGHLWSSADCSICNGVRKTLEISALHFAKAASNVLRTRCLESPSEQPRGQVRRG